MLPISRTRFLAILIFMIFLAMNFFSWGDNSIAEGLLTIFTLCLGLIGLVASLPPLVMLILVIKNYLKQTGHEYQYFISSARTSADARHYQLENQLKDFDFSFLGNYDASHQTEAQLSYRSWVYLDETRTISAAIIENQDGRHSVEFCSRYPDKFTLSTFYNMELELDSELVMARYFMNSLENALAFHSSHGALLISKHGKAIMVESLEATFESPELKREQHRSLDRAMMKKLLFPLAVYLAYPLLGLICYLLIPFIGAHLISLFYFPVICVQLWFFRLELEMEIFQPVESRKPRKSAS